MRPRLTIRNAFFSDVIVRLSPAIICIVRQRRPLVQGRMRTLSPVLSVATGVFIFSQPAFRDFSSGFVSTDVRQALLRRHSPYLCLDGVQFADPFQRFLRQG